MQKIYEKFTRIKLIKGQGLCVFQVCRHIVTLMQKLIVEDDKYATNNGRNRKTAGSLGLDPQLGELDL